MNAPLRLIDGGLGPARWNVAMTAALAELRAAGRIRDTLRFHVYPRSVLIGRHQALAAAADPEACRARGIEVARRVTGGGAVYMSPGVLAWDLAASRAALGADLDQAAAAVCGAVAAGLARLGLAACHRLPDGIEAAGRKLAGASGCFDGPALLHQGAILVDVDFDEMEAALALPAASLRGRLVTVTELLGRVPPMAELVEALATGMSAALGRALLRAAPGETELRLAGELLEREIGLDAFVAGGEAACAAPRRRAS